MTERANGKIVRGITLKRRRSRVPWIYLVYHARPARLRAGPVPAAALDQRTDVLSKVAVATLAAS
jgi:hypothetical protein